LTKTPRDATGLEALLSDFFRMPVRCLQLRGAMRTLDADQWMHIGLSGRNQVLGQDALLGTSVWDQQAGIELELGPVGWKSYLDFLPGRGGLRALCALVRFYIGPGFDVQVTLRLRGEQIPAALLSAEAALGAAVAEPAAPPAAPAPIRGAALGLTAFLSYGTVLHGQPIVRLGVIARYRDEPQRSLP
jgi:predicted component of type VI protein secretion system